MDYCKRHSLTRIHVENVQISYTQKHGISVNSLLREKLAAWKERLDHSKRLQTNEEQIPNGQCSSCYRYECFDVVCTNHTRL